jgi:RES domain-containing protein
LRFQGTGYRAHDPKWAFSPTSGEGAKAKGGRFNPIGIPALYLSLSLEGIFLEMGHGFAHRFDPLTICSYEIDVEDVIDLRTDDARHAASVELADMACAWALEIANGREPPSWILAGRLMERGGAGILAPSFARSAHPDMHNLVLWRWGPHLPHRVSVHDPENRLPKDQSSWEV